MIPTLLIVAVVSMGGGKPGARATPTVLPGVTVAVAPVLQPVAAAARTGLDGRVRVRVPAGVYRLEARLTPNHPCVAYVRVHSWPWLRARGRRSQLVRVSCAIP